MSDRNTKLFKLSDGREFVVHKDNDSVALAAFASGYEPDSTVIWLDIDDVKNGPLLTCLFELVNDLPGEYDTPYIPFPGDMPGV